MSAHAAAPAAPTQVDPARTAPAGDHPQAPLRLVDPATTEQSRPTVVEVAEESMFYVDAIAVGAAIMPGFLLCVPALLFILVPIIAMGLLAAAAGLIFLLAALPLRIGWRVARRLRHGLPRDAPRTR